MVRAGDLVQSFVIRGRNPLEIRASGQSAEGSRPRPRGGRRNPLEIRASGQSLHPLLRQDLPVVIPWKSGQVVRVHRHYLTLDTEGRNPLEIRASGQRACTATPSAVAVVIPWKSGQVVRAQEAKR